MLLLLELDILEIVGPFFVIREELQLLVADFANTKLCKKPDKCLKPWHVGYSSESTQRELSNEYQHGRV